MDASGNAALALGLVTVPSDLGARPEPILMSVQGSGGPGGARLFWAAVPGEPVYDVIAGDLGQISPQPDRISLGPVRVLAAGLTAIDFSEGAGAIVPAAGRGFFYLVQSRGAQRASGYGTESATLPRLPASCDVGCPGEVTEGSAGGGQHRK